MKFVGLSIQQKSGYPEGMKEAEPFVNQNDKGKQTLQTWLGRNNDLENGGIDINIGVTVKHKLDQNLQNSSENKDAILGRTNENPTDQTVQLM